MPIVPDRCPDFENARRADRRRQHAQQSTNLGVDERQPLLVACPRDVAEDRIGQRVQASKVTLDGIGNDLAHNRVSLTGYSLVSA